MEEKEKEELIKDLEEIESMCKEMKEPDLLIYTIKNLPVIKTNGKIFKTNEVSDEEKEILTNKLIEIIEGLIDFSKLEIKFCGNNKKDIMKNNKNDKMEIKEIVIEGNYEEAMKQLENADLPEEVKACVKKEIRKHFNK